MTMKRIIIATLILALGVFVNTAAAFGDMPEQVTIDGMAKYFVAVEFDHAMHTDLGEDCSVCHHHATGTGTAEERCIRCHADDKESAEVGCAACHIAEPFSAEQIQRVAADLYQYHIDKPGLKAAYHWNCVGCHEQMDGPTDCLDCHERTPEGDAFYHTEVKAATEQGSH